jgi:hypothetical protein
MGHPKESWNDLIVVNHDSYMLGANYQFTAPTYYAASDGQWSSYTRSETVWSKELPAALEP